MCIAKCVLTVVLGAVVLASLERITSLFEQDTSCLTVQLFTRRGERWGDACRKGEGMCVCVCVSVLYLSMHVCLCTYVRHIREMCVVVRVM